MLLVPSFWFLDHYAPNTVIYPATIGSESLELGLPIAPARDIIVHDLLDGNTNLVLFEDWSYHNHTTTLATIVRTTIVGIQLRVSKCTLPVPCMRLPRKNCLKVDSGHATVLFVFRNAKSGCVTTVINECTYAHSITHFKTTTARHREVPDRA